MKNLATLVLLALALVVPAAAHAESPSASRTGGEMSVPAVAQRGPNELSRGSHSEAQRYAAREQASPDAKKFRGGDTIVITATAAIIILLGIIIIILLV